jgi:hypothetical protein
MEVGAGWAVLVAMEGEEIREESRRLRQPPQPRVWRGARRTLVGAKAIGRTVIFFFTKAWKREEAER